MLANIQFRTFCFRVCYIETYRLKYKNYYFVPSIYFLSHIKGRLETEGIREQSVDL
jgi:hypothetical protein